MLDVQARRLPAPVLDEAAPWLSEAVVSPTGLTNVGACVAVAVAERAWDVALGYGFWAGYSTASTYRSRDTQLVARPHLNLCWIRRTHGQGPRRPAAGGPRD